MSYELSDKTKESLSKVLGMSWEEFSKMDFEEAQKFIETKLGKKLTWPKGAKVDGLPIRTMEDVDKKITRIKRKSR